MYQPPQQQPPQWQPQQPPQWQEYQQWQQWQQQRLQADLNRSYTAAAWLSAALVFVFVVPGLIATIINLREANAVKERTGVAPQGYGCLWAVLVWCLAPLVVAAFIALLIILGTLGAGIH